MTNPTPEQIEAAAKALYAHEPWSASLDYKIMTGSEHRLWEDLLDEDRQEYSAQARAALVAAAGGTPQEPGEDRVMQIAADLAMVHPFTLQDGKAIARAALAIAAPSQVDEAKLAKVICASYENEQGLKIRDDRRTANAVAEWLRGGGQ